MALISLLQEPLGITPTNAEHVYTLSGSSAITQLQDFRFVVDVYFRPNTQPEKVARLKIYPNEYNRGIFDVSEILQNYIKPNPKSEQVQGAGWNSGTNSSYTANTSNGLISNSRYISQQNAYTNDTNYSPEFHVEEYRVLYGYEYYSSSLDSYQTIIPTGVTIYPSVFSVSVVGATSLNWTGADVNNPFPQGVFIEQLNSTGGTITATTITASTGSFSGVTPSNFDVARLTEVYSNRSYYFIYYGAGWLLAGQSTPAAEFDPTYGGLYQTMYKFIYPGGQNDVVNFNYNKVIEQYWNPSNVDGTNNHLFYEAYKYEFVNYTGQSLSATSFFLNTFGEDFASVDTSSAQTTSNLVRHRTLHYECPIVLNFFNKKNLLFTNQVADIRVLKYNTSSGFYDTEIYTVGTPPYTDNWYDPKEVITTFTNIYDNIPGEQIYVYATDGTSRISEIVRYDISSQNCLDDPLHFMFLNMNGVWDTVTFSRKNVKNYNIKRDDYASNSSLNKTLYNRLSTDARNVIYNLDIEEQVVAQTDFVNENDRNIYEQLFMSPEVFLLLDHEEYLVDLKSKTPYTIPVSITSNQVEEFKQRYKKLYQYSITFTYNPIKLFRTGF